MVDHELGNAVALSNCCLRNHADLGERDSVGP